MADQKPEPEPKPSHSTERVTEQELTTSQPKPNNAESFQDVEHLRGSSASTGQPHRTMGSSLIQSFVASNPPLGMWQATGEVGSKIPTLSEIHDGSFGREGWSQEGQMEHKGVDPREIHRRATRVRKTSIPMQTKSTFMPREEAFMTETIHEESVIDDKQTRAAQLSQFSHALYSKDDSKNKQIVIMTTAINNNLVEPDETGTYPNGYRFPKKHTWLQSLVIGLQAFWKFFLTPLGFAITIYGLNIVGWGAMIFFVLLEATPAMCHPSCEDVYSARRIWIELDSQILTALFCVTGFGLAPWRARDFYYLMRWRVGRNQKYHRKLAGIYRGWYRLPASNELPDSLGPPPVYNKKNPQQDGDPPPYSAQEIQELEDNSAVPLPASSIPDPPLTGVRAQPTKSWNLDLVIWMYVWNTFIQAALAGIMWGMNRFDRPSWATGFLISIGCITGIVAGIVVFTEGKKVKKVEGIPVKEYDIFETREDYQQRKAKEARKQVYRTVSNGPRVKRTEKVKGSSWYNRQ